MSHFSVLVITATDPNVDDTLAKALQPFHEFECTGTVDEYIQSLDKLAEIRESYEKDTATLVLQRPDGSKVYAFTNKGEYIDEVLPFYDKVERTLNLPESWEQLRSEPVKDYQAFVDFAVYENGGALIEGDAEPDLEDEHKWGWVRVKDGEVTEIVRRTNPNKQWDWWVVGGRYSGKLTTKSGEVVNQCQMKDLDFESMRQAVVKRRSDAVESAIADMPAVETLVIWRKHSETITATRAAWEAAQSGKSFADWLTANPDNPTTIARDKRVLNALGDWGAGVPDSAPDPFEWARNAPALTCWAVLKDGQWQEKGEMGWFGMAANEKPEGEWEDLVSNLVRDLPEDFFISVVDCHI